MQQENMLTQQDLKLIEKLIDKKFGKAFDEKFDKKFEKNAQEIIGEVNKLVDPIAKDVHLIKNQLVMFNKTNIVFRNDLAIAHERMDNLEIAWTQRVYDKDL